MDPELQSLGVQLGSAAVRNTATVVAERINTARTRRKDQETIAELEDIVNELTSDKSELVRIAQAYEQELVSQRLSPTDVDYITSSLLPVIQQLAETASQGDGTASEVEKLIEILKPILSVETVTVLQRIGFNFRKAIGEPLTDLLSRLILSRATFDPAQGLELQRLAVERDLVFAELARDPNAHARLLALMGR